MDSALDNAELPALGFPIRRSPDQSLVSGSPKLFAATHVLHRLSAPRHPPRALCSLVTRSSNSPKPAAHANCCVEAVLRCSRTVVRSAPVLARPCIWRARDGFGDSGILCANRAMFRESRMNGVQGPGLQVPGSCRCARHPFRLLLLPSFVCGF